MQFLLVSSSGDLGPRSYPEAHSWDVGTRKEAMRAASHPGPYRGAHELAGTPRVGGGWDPDETHPKGPAYLGFSLCRPGY